MTKDKALFKWFSDFAASNGMDSHVVTSVPDDAVLPYLTYEYSASAFGDGNVPVTVDMWFHTYSEAEPNAVAERFRKYIRENECIKCDEGFIWAKTGAPFVVSMNDGDNTDIKRRQINLTLEFITE